MMLGVVGGVIFTRIHMPLPWVLGPMVVLIIASKLGHIHLYWSLKERNLGLIIIGYASGSSINKETLYQIMQQLPWMAVMTVTLIAFSAITAVFVSKLTEIDYPSILTGGIPGGLTQMVILAEEMGGLDLTVITFLQVMRLILVVSCVPLIVFSPLYAAEKSAYTTAVAQTASEPWDVLIPKIVLFAAISVLSAISSKRLKFPTPYFVGPILGVAIFNILGFHAPSLSPVLLMIAQFTMGCYLGLLLEPGKLQNKVKVVLLSIINTIIMILFALGLSYILIKVHGIGTVTSFLCLAPGSSDQMSIVASVISANVSIVTGYQMFRVLFVNFAVPPLLKWFYRYHTRKKHADCSFDSAK
nr:AbrB family transcriptional regulator [Candidatus Formimonas warabiya]